MYSIKFEHQKLILFKWLDSLWYTYVYIGHTIQEIDVYQFDKYF